MEKGYTVDGYVFKTEAEAREARNEIEGIEYLKKRTDFKNPKNVLEVYNKILDKQLFKTPIGYAFLKEMQQILKKSEELKDAKIRDIPVAAKASKNEKKFKEKHVSFVLNDVEKKHKNSIINMAIVIVFLIVTIGIVMAISNNSSNINILNYKNRLEREYQDKTNELAKWESSLREREEALESGDN